MEGGDSADRGERKPAASGPGLAALCPHGHGAAGEATAKPTGSACLHTGNFSFIAIDAGVSILCSGLRTAPGKLLQIHFAA